MNYKTEEIKRKLVMKHYLKSINKKNDINSFEIKIDQFSPRCVDELHLGINFKNNKISEIAFAGEGCAIFLASTDLFIEQIKNKTKTEINYLINNYENMIFNKKKYDEKKLDNLIIFKNVKNHLNRLECAQMITNALKKII